MKVLRENGFRATATIRDNRLKKCSVDSAKTMAKYDRVTYDFRFEKHNELLLVRWVDNNVVSIIINYDKIVPLHQARRWSKAKKEPVQIQQPNLYRSYNSRMGGVDLSEQSVNTYRVGIRGKKRWWVLFT
ncbi:unnamed protein product [Acanthoscelides obtectus]|uniref:PiggyBac transposable element-derived protein domain-containing protein n=1 Tax=Acanthoscelides obtectus TaxID=200917 RepID=A0A9P0PMC9_ACAOB|nr:unnamed protein product [Acanthoscelides obtectus]CAK1639274.1 PiggyBac transposable element-derived protein 2 [Acanthoscelides obtectus]